MDKGGCFHFGKYCTTPALLCSTFKQKYCRHFGCFLCLWKIQVLLILSISSYSAHYCDELRRRAAKGSLTVTEEGRGPFLRAWEVTVSEIKWSHDNSCLVEISLSPITMLEMVYHIPLEDQEEITWLLLHQFSSEHCDLKSWAHLQIYCRIIYKKTPTIKKRGGKPIFREEN